MLLKKIETNDPYVSERTYIPITRGTYFGKLKARNPFYNGRIMRVYSGRKRKNSLKQSE